MLDIFYEILKSINEVKGNLNNNIVFASVKDRLIISNYGNIIKKVIKFIEEEKDLTKNTRLCMYFHDDGYIGMKLTSELFICTSGLQPNRGYFKELISLIKSESSILKEKVEKIKENKNSFETPAEIQNRLDMYYSEEKVDEFIRDHIKLTMKFTDYSNDDNKPGTKNI